MSPKSESKDFSKGAIKIISAEVGIITVKESLSIE